MTSWLLYPTPVHSRAVAVALALIAAVAFAGATTLQVEASQAAPRTVGLRLRLFAHLLADRRFNFGAVLDVVGGLAQFFALKVGAVELVMPLISSGLVVAIVWHHRRLGLVLTWRDRLALVAVVGALADILALAPTGRDRPGPFVAQLAVAALGAFGAMGSLTVWRRALLRRSWLVATVAGALLGVVALLERTVGILWSGTGVRGVLMSWQLWALVVIGIGALVVVQSAFGVGRMLSVAPIVGVVEPIVGSALAVLVEGLGPRIGAGRAALLGAALVVEAVSIVVLARGAEPRKEVR